MVAPIFDYLVGKENYDYFAIQAVEAEKAMEVSLGNCAIMARRALELAVCDWIDYSYSHDYEEYSFDESLVSTGEEKRVKPEVLKVLSEDGIYRFLFSSGKSKTVPDQNLSLREILSCEAGFLLMIILNLSKKSQHARAKQGNNRDDK